MAKVDTLILSNSKTTYLFATAGHTIERKI